MAASSSSSPLLLLHKPTCNFYFAASSVSSYIASARFRIFPLNRRRRRIWSLSRSNSMADDLVKVNARRDGEERSQTLEQEAFINGSSEVQNDAAGGIEAVVNRLSKWIVAGLFGSVLLLRHDGAALWAVVGSVSNSALSVALKRLLNQERPVATLRLGCHLLTHNPFLSSLSLLSCLLWSGLEPMSSLCSLVASSSHWVLTLHG